jgi:hypothetical protein
MATTGIRVNNHCIIVPPKYICMSVGEGYDPPGDFAAGDK